MTDERLKEIEADIAYRRETKNLPMAYLIVEELIAEVRRLQQENAELRSRPSIGAVVREDSEFSYVYEMAPVHIKFE